MKYNKERNKEISQKNIVNRFHILGWILFIICAFFFIVASFKNNDIWTFIGSVIFLFACVVFLIPLLIYMIK
jgi:predicted membrane channel-forming protein YqfA (hemolysin III family)